MPLRLAGLYIMCFRTIHIYGVIIKMDEIVEFILKCAAAVVIPFQKIIRMILTLSCSQFS